MECKGCGATLKVVDERGAQVCKYCGREIPHDELQAYYAVVVGPGAVAVGRGSVAVGGGGVVIGGSVNGGVIITGNGVRIGK